MSFYAFICLAYIALLKLDSVEISSYWAEQLFISQLNRKQTIPEAFLGTVPLKGISVTYPIYDLVSSITEAVASRDQPAQTTKTVFVTPPWDFLPKGFSLLYEAPGGICQRSVMTQWCWW